MTKIQHCSVFCFPNLSVFILHFLHLQLYSSARCNTSPLVVLISVHLPLFLLHGLGSPSCNSYSLTPLILQTTKYPFDAEEKASLWQICWSFPNVLNVITWSRITNCLWIRAKCHMHVTAHFSSLFPLLFPEQLDWVPRLSCSPGTAQEAALRGEERPL